MCEPRLVESPNVKFAKSRRIITKSITKDATFSFMLLYKYYMEQMSNCKDPNQLLNSITFFKKVLIIKMTRVLATTLEKYH